MRRLVGRMVDALSERLADRISRKVLSQFYFRELHPATLLHREAQAEAAAYVKEKMPEALYFMEREPLLRYAVDPRDPAGIVPRVRRLQREVDLGDRPAHVADGPRLRQLRGPARGLDGQQGREGPILDRRTAAGRPAERAALPGWFSDTLPPFLQAHPDDVAFMHIDCDLYSSTRDVLEATAAQLREGTVIVLDDYFNFPGWRNHEFKALQELVGRTGMEYEYAGYARHQVALIVKRAPSRPAP